MRTSLHWNKNTTSNIDLFFYKVYIIHNHSKNKKTDHCLLFLKSKTETNKKQDLATNNSFYLNQKLVEIGKISFFLWQQLKKIGLIEIETDSNV